MSAKEGADFDCKAPDTVDPKYCGLYEFDTFNGINNDVKFICPNLRPGAKAVIEATHIALCLEKDGWWMVVELYANGQKLDNGVSYKFGGDQAPGDTKAKDTWLYWDWKAQVEVPLDGPSQGEITLSFNGRAVHRDGTSPTDVRITSGGPDGKGGSVVVHIAEAEEHPHPPTG